MLATGSGKKEVHFRANHQLRQQ